MPHADDAAVASETAENYYCDGDLWLALVQLNLMEEARKLAENPASSPRVLDSAPVSGGES